MGNRIARINAAKPTDMTTLPKASEEPIKSAATPTPENDAPLEKKSAEDFKKIEEANRRNYVLDGGYDAAMDKGNVSPAEYVQAMVRKAQTEGRELNSYETALQAIKGTDTLTPEQKKKKERREMLGNVFSNLGNLIGNVANLHYATKGGIPVDLNTSQAAQNDRYQALVDKRKALKEQNDAILLAARQDDIKAMRDAAIEARKQADRDREFAWNVNKYNQDFEYKQRQDALDTIIKNAEVEERKRANQANEALRWASRNDINGSIGGADGYTYTRNSDLTDLEVRELVRGALNDEMLKQFTKTEVDDYGTPHSTGEIDWLAALSYAASQGLISSDELTSRGFERSKNRTREQKKGGGTRGDDGKNLSNLFD